MKVKANSLLSFSGLVWVQGEIIDLARYEIPQNILENLLAEGYVETVDEEEG